VHAAEYLIGFDRWHTAHGYYSHSPQIRSTDLQPAWQLILQSCDRRARSTANGLPEQTLSTDLNAHAANALFFDNFAPNLKRIAFYSLIFGLKTAINTTSN